MRCRAFVAAALVVPSLSARPAGVPQDAAALGPRLLQDAAVKTAVDAARASEAQTIAEQIEVCEVEAPPFKEQKRAELLAGKFPELGLQDVRIDQVGNVLGERPGTAPRPHLVIAAHLDTVFPEGTNVKTTTEGSVIRGPGIGDDCRGLAVLLAIVRAMNQARVRTPGSITFVANVGEEGLGDLRGVKHLFNENMKGRIDRPAGNTAESTAIVQAAISVNKALGLPVALDEGSTDSNIPMSLGIPAITIDGGGRGTGAHALTEQFDTAGSWKVTQRAVQLAVALAQQ